MRRRHSIFRYVIFAGILFAGIGLSLLTAPSQRRVRVNWPAMGTVAAITFREGSPETHDAVEPINQRVVNEQLTARIDVAFHRLFLDVHGINLLSSVPIDR